MKSNEIVIVVAEKPAAKLATIEYKTKRKRGVLKGKIKIAKDLDAPLPDDILELFR